MNDNKNVQNSHQINLSVSGQEWARTQSHRTETLTPRVLTVSLKISPLHRLIYSHLCEILISSALQLRQLNGDALEPHLLTCFEGVESQQTRVHTVSNTTTKGF